MVWQVDRPPSGGEEGPGRPPSPPTEGISPDSLPSKGLVEIPPPGRAQPGSPRAPPNRLAECRFYNSRSSPCSFPVLASQALQSPTRPRDSAPWRQPANRQPLPHAQPAPLAPQGLVPASPFPGWPSKGGTNTSPKRPESASIPVSAPEGTARARPGTPRKGLRPLHPRGPRRFTGQTRPVRPGPVGHRPLLSFAD